MPEPEQIPVPPQPRELALGLAPGGELAPEQIYTLVTITVPPEIEKMSVNLKAPIVINMENNKAVQIIVEDDFQVKHPIYETLKKRKEGEVC